MVLKKTNAKTSRVKNNAAVPFVESKVERTSSLAVIKQVESWRKFKEAQNEIKEKNKAAQALLAQAHVGKLEDKVSLANFNFNLFPSLDENLTFWIFLRFVSKKLKLKLNCRKQHRTLNLKKQEFLCLNKLKRIQSINT